MAGKGKIRSRAYGQDGDLSLVLGFLSEAVAASPPHHCWHPGDFVWTLFQNEVFDARENVHLFEGDDGLLGVAIFEEPDGLVMQTRSDLRGSGGIEAAMLSWGEGRTDATIHTLSPETDAETNSLLENRGFERKPNPSFNNMLHSLEGVSENAPPDGWLVRPVGGEDEWERRVNLHREVWNSSRVTLAAYEKLRETPGYDPNLDLVAAAPDGTFGAYCICWHDERSRTGLFEPVGTHPAHREKGLGKAIVAEGLRRLRDLGSTHAFVTCVGGKTPAFHLYESAGFEVVEREYAYMKPNPLE